MKYTDCPQCKNKIIDRSPLKCLYCGYDSSKVEVQKLELIDIPKPPKRENYVVFQFLAIIVSLIGAIVFLITLISSHTTVVDEVLVETGNFSTIRLIAGIITVVSFFTFLTTNRSYEQDEMMYNNEVRRISDINQKIESGATLEDFEESDWAIIVKAQEDKNKSKKPVNQKYPNSIYYK